MDLVQLRGLRAVGVHGVLPEERERPQPFEVDVDVEADLSLAGSSDALGDTVDYGLVAERVCRVITDESFALLERIATRIAEVVFECDERIASCAVTVWKLRPPVGVDLDRAGVTIDRQRGL